MDPITVLRLLRLVIPSPRRGLDRRACSRLPVALPSTDPGTNGPLSYTFLKSDQPQEKGRHCVAPVTKVFGGPRLSARADPRPTCATVVVANGQRSTRHAVIVIAACSPTLLLLIALDRMKVAAMLPIVCYNTSDHKHRRQLLESMWFGLRR